MTTKIKELINKAAIVQEHFAVGWVTWDGAMTCPEEIKTLISKCPEAELVVFGDETTGIEIDGKLWAAQMPHELRGPGKQHKLKHMTWLWLDWVSGRIEPGDGHEFRFIEIVDLAQN